MPFFSTGPDVSVDQCVIYNVAISYDERVLSKQLAHVYINTSVQTVGLERWIVCLLALAARLGLTEVAAACQLLFVCNRAFMR